MRCFPSATPCVRILLKVSDLATKPSISRPTAIIIRSKIAMMWLIIAAPALVSVLKQYRSIIGRTERDSHIERQIALEHIRRAIQSNCAGHVTAIVAVMHLDRVLLRVKERDVDQIVGTVRIWARVFVLLILHDVHATPACGVGGGNWGARRGGSVVASGGRAVGGDIGGRVFRVREKVACGD